jgi:hypothetical protein
MITLNSLTLDVLDSATQANLRRVWAWQARVGLGPKFGTRPIVWYQRHHAIVSSLIVEKAKKEGCLDTDRIHMQQGYLWAVGKDHDYPLGAVANFYNEADIRIRKYTNGSKTNFS